jgi:hypothetical protein
VVGAGVAVGAALGAVVGAAVGAPDGASEGVAELVHAANTRIAVDSSPINRFDIDILPIGQ